ncbi:MAG TPA: phosphate acyltransferase PlsX [Candidatus Limnocylindria bacterium]|nr:phosphate acyltransferase PlsX [Candidatus Limnocylindria bacterium]
MRIAVDAMGGDFAPREVVRGAINYAAANADEVILVGDLPRIQAEVDGHGHGRPASVRFVDAPEVIGMGESPAQALRGKRRSSIRVATDLVRDGRADAVVSAGSTGATMAAAVFRLGRIDGVERPALGAHLVTATGPIMILDVGANVDSDAGNLLQFAVMGAIYAEQVLKVPRPRIGLLNIGEEVEKGSGVTREAHEQMRGAGLNFVGNVEGNDLMAHAADVVVCDGFVGNVVIKFFEGLTSYIFRSLRSDLQQGAVAPLALLALKPGFDRLKHRFDFERYGGAPLLGVRGVSIVTHGRARARMVEHAIRVASEAAAANVPQLIADWTRQHPALARPAAAAGLPGGTRPVTSAPQGEA